MASLVRGYLLSGQIRKALSLSENHVKVRKESHYLIHAAKGQYYLAYELYLLGELREGEERIKDSIMIFNNGKHYFWEVLCLKMLDHLMIIRGAQEEALQVRIKEKLAMINSFHNTDNMIDEIAHIKNTTELLSSIAAEVNHVERYLLNLNTQAEIYLFERKYNEAQNIIYEVISNDDYRLIQADACLILAKIKKGQGNIKEAISAATNAYKKAWCNGSIYVYKQALEQAKNILNEYDSPYPDIT
ncbi:MAG: hypothetical protein RM022_004935 [Nostoc sp. EfeVER01]|uniref:hypothetical protein n=1 Tax=unclassified Nostoc TaxID=2593658 RepID=UPI002AD1ED9F|nr:MULTISPECIES: hypothetical protein [unclassified Nostoc]MDZ7947835.1 hypothetical protein [Nostoc sp. EfeVER01]MDZ7994367.1 hypothetical protein [Nostoc sp. EspVER01]